MAPQPLTNEPTTLAAATSVQWRRSYGDFPPADGWTLKYYFRGASAFEVVATDAGSEWAGAITPAISTGKLPGVYRWVAFAEKGAGGTLERYQLAAGSITITPDLTTAAAGALSPFAERMLAAIEAVLAKRATSDQEAYTIGDRQISKIPFAQLVRYRNQYAAEVARLKNGGRLPAVTVAFGRA